MDATWGPNGFWTSVVAAMVLRMVVGAAMVQVMIGADSLDSCSYVLLVLNPLGTHKLTEQIHHLLLGWCSLARQSGWPFFHVILPLLVLTIRLWSKFHCLVLASSWYCPSPP